MATTRKRAPKAQPADIELNELDAFDMGAVPGLHAVPNMPEDDAPELVEDAPAKPKRTPAAPRKGRSKKTSLGETVGTLLGTMAGGAMVLVSGRVAGPIVGPQGAMTPTEAQSITRPLGNIAGRRAPKVILPGIPEADRADVEEILATLLEWIARCAVIAVQRWGELQQARALAAANTSATPPRRENMRPVDAPPPSIGQDEPAPIQRPAPTPAQPGVPISTMGYAEALIRGGVGYGDRGEGLLGG